MAITFLTPMGALLAVVAILPLAALALVSRRAGRMRRALALRPRPRGRLVLPVLATLCAAGLLALAAAQPVLHRTTTVDVRTDAEVFVAIDVSRSMLARARPGAPTRFERARAVAAGLRDALPGVPVGLASITDRVLPHLFPSADDAVFQSTLARAIGIERPPPRGSIGQTATSFDALADVVTQRFFTPTVKHRLLVVLSDGESNPVTVGRLARVFGRGPGLDTVYVQFWAPDERVFTNGVPEPYRPDPSAGTLLEALAVATGGSVYPESRASEAIRRSRRLLGNGPTRAEGIRESRRGLTPWIALAALAPVGLLLARTDR